MNRRNFLKTTSTAIIGSLCIPNIVLSHQSTELDDLYNYLESKTIQHPIRGEIPFKLYPYQKDILKEIHENQSFLLLTYLPHPNLWIHAILLETIPYLTADLSSLIR